MNTKKTILLLTLLWAAMGPGAITLRAQTSDPSLLRQGKHFTEAEGKATLETYAATHHDRKSWEKRANRIRRGILEGTGVDQLPPNTPLKPIIHAKRTYDGYTVENVAFESLPGIFVTGNLYRPAQPQASYAAILAPHGHGEQPAVLRVFDARHPRPTHALMGDEAVTQLLASYGKKGKR